MKPEPELAGDFQGGQGLGVIAGMRMRGLVAGDADLVKEIQRLAWHDLLGLQPAQQVGLCLVRGRENARAGRNLLGEKLAELANLDQTGVRIVPKIPFGQCAQPHELRIVRVQKVEIC